MIHLGAFESTRIHGSGRDVLGTTHHISRWRHDLDLLLEANLTDLRYPVPWHRIETRPGEFDFRWIDGPMDYMRRNGMRPILDPLHHTSFPEWLERGFADPAFPALYSRFLGKLADRYEWVDRYTVINEPFTNAILSAYMGVWHPYQESEEDFVRMAVQMSKVVCRGARQIRRRNADIELIRVDTCESHSAMDEASEEWAEFCNRRRFLVDDLTGGGMQPEHPLWDYCVRNGVNTDELKRLSDERVDMDVFGLDYYCFSEIDWFWNAKKGRPDISWPVSSPRGFASVAGDYATRYRKPLMLTETNIRGTVEERISWLKYMEEQCELLLARDVDLRGFCWFPSVDSTDWNHLCARCTETVDPQGIWCLDDERWTRYPSELSTWYAELASGKATAASLPAYPFLETLSGDLVGHAKLMSWRPDLETEEELAA